MSFKKSHSDVASDTPPSSTKPIKPLQPKPEIDSDVHPQRQPGESPLPDESDNIPGDENDPNLADRSKG